MHRIHGSHNIFTQTGRITMQEPNLQNVPRESNITQLSKIKSPKSKTKLPKELKRIENILETIQIEPPCLTLRHAFVPFSGGLLVSGDYSQLELRILGHLSKDKKLVKILNSGGDVFNNIARQIRNITSTNVSNPD